MLSLQFLRSYDGVGHRADLCEVLLSLTVCFSHLTTFFIQTFSVALSIAQVEGSKKAREELLYDLMHLQFNKGTLPPKFLQFPQ